MRDDTVVQRQTLGVTVVELLIVMAILGIIMTVLAAYFVQQTRLTSQTQARNEVEVKVRTVAEVMAQDILMSGSRIINSNGSVRSVALSDYCTLSAVDDDPCVRVDSGLLVTTFYATSLRGEPFEDEINGVTVTIDPACRRVIYRLDNDGTLRRSDVACVRNDSLQPFATNITAATVTFECANGTVVSDPLSCYGASSFPIQATIAVAGRSDNTRENLDANVTLTATMPNLRPPPTSE
jgi:type II secretory pathway component PulJ